MCDSSLVPLSTKRMKVETLMHDDDEHDGDAWTMTSLGVWWKMEIFSIDGLLCVPW